MQRCGCIFSGGDSEGVPTLSLLHYLIQCVASVLRKIQLHQWKRWQRPAAPGQTGKPAEHISIGSQKAYKEPHPTAFYAAPKKEFPFWEASNKAIFQDFLGFFVSTFWGVIPFEFAWKVDQKVPEYQGKVPPKAPLCTSPGDPPKKEKRTHKRWLDTTLEKEGLSKACEDFVGKISGSSVLPLFHYQSSSYSRFTSKFELNATF